MSPGGAPPAMTTIHAIERKLRALNPQFLRVENESHRHNVPPGAQSHVKVTVVSRRFDSQPLLARHRLVNDILRDELRGEVHALALHTITPEEWSAGARAAQSPPCLGGSAADKGKDKGADVGNGNAAGNGKPAGKG